MAGSNLSVVLSVLKAIKAQDADEAASHVSPDLIQHYPYMEGGLAGLRRYITGSTKESLQLRVVRALEDGDYVVTQVTSESTGDNMFAVYRLQEGLIVEHWAFASPDAPLNLSGHTQLDGPTEATNLDRTAANKAFVRKYYETFHIRGDRTRNDEFFVDDTMVRHEPGVEDGVKAFLRDVKVLMKHRTIDEIKLIVGRGDLVFIAAKGTHEDKPCAYIDLYRVAKGKLVEHWGFPQMAPLTEQSKHANAML